MTFSKKKKRAIRSPGNLHLFLWIEGFFWGVFVAQFKQPCNEKGKGVNVLFEARPKALKPVGLWLHFGLVLIFHDVQQVHGNGLFWEIGIRCTSKLRDPRKN